MKPTKNFNETTTNPNGSNSGKWTREEHLRFIKGLGIYGKNWKRVESFVSTRSGAQIRSHAQKFFCKLNRSEKNKGAKGGIQLQHGETSEDINNSMGKIIIIFNLMKKRKRAKLNYVNVNVLIC